MKLPNCLAALAAIALTQASAELLFLDNFDAPDATNFDGAAIAGRLSGTLAGETYLRSWGFQQDINNNQLLMPRRGSDGVRFEVATNDPTGGAADRYDWAGAPGGAAILNSGGFVVSFDWIPVENTLADWVSFQVGTINADNGNLTNDDYGILFRNNGDTERFDNSVNLGAGGSFTASAGGVVRQVEITYEFTSFADGTNVTATSTVDGVQVASDVFTWDGNGGQMRMELGHLAANTRVDNLSISTIETDGFIVTAEAEAFLSSAPVGTAVATLSAALDGAPEATTYAFVAGDGDDDNALFQISGDEIQLAAGFDFLNEADGTTYSVRVMGTGDVSAETGEVEVVLVLVADSDSDTLPDSWELAATDTGGGGNLTDLDGSAAGPGPGAGTGNFDGDGLTDLEEYDLNQAGTAVSPILADTDGDTLDDDAEIAGAGSRPPTDPADADSDDDSLDDGQESNSGTYVDVDDTGTDPTAPDSDADGYRDAFETLRGGDPTNTALVPPLSPSVSLVAITDDASTGIDMNNTYTHAVSGGGAATVNGVLLEEFSPTLSPANFTWDTGAATMSQITLTGGNLGDWDPVAGGVTGAGLLDLLGGFTYSGSGANAGSMQTYTLSGLTPGQSYLLRLYVRIWDTEGSGRPADLSFTNGGAIDYAPILEDRSNIVLGGGASVHAAYAIEYTYVAAGTELIVGSAVPVGAQVPSGSYHMFGLTNEIGGPAAPAEITGVSYDPETPSVTITFNGQAGKDYALDVATSMTPGGMPGGWFELNDSVPSTGMGSTTVDTVVVGTAPTLFYRLRDPAEQPEP